MIIREQRDTDDAAVAEVLRRAFGNNRVPDLAAALRARRDRGPALLAVDADVVIGHVQLSRSWVDAARELVEVLVLSPLGVEPRHQRQGVGKALLEAAVQAADGAGAPFVFLEGDPAYYSKLGWERAAEHGLVRPSPRIPDAACQVRLLARYESWMTGALIYNDTFWSFDCVGLRADPATSAGFVPSPGG